MGLVRAPDFCKVVVEHAEPRRDEVAFAFLPSDLRQRLRRAATIGERHGFEIETARRVWAVGQHVLWQEQVLPAPPHRVERRARLLAFSFLRVLFLCGWQLENATSIVHDRRPGEFLSQDILDVFERCLIDGEKGEAVAVAPLPGSFVFDDIGR